MSEQPLHYEQTPVDLPNGTEAYFHTAREDLKPYEEVQNTQLEPAKTPEIQQLPPEVQAMRAQAYWTTRFRREEMDLAA